ncbi:TIGR04255 family protein [Pseudoxanthomonas indica]|uniref:TIGR04255 family protein n=1 Tax=Pseudoxanthomonas indica TaxID=428993 RepID=A0A1T5JZU9_9GAMM|nr:TIGR04255 family protein [Pseudoxanthomonas indica]GGD45613.1 hypothetical protein GCM10007235_16910 [Pseudoxanthomonas indica]SKC56916.1 TIGR04255 family protein [Pseudoxanthomonas indica]
MNSKSKSASGKDSTPQGAREYARSFVTQIVCELKFPTILEFGNSRPPASFVTALRKKYPNLEAGQQVNISFGGTSETTQAHILREVRGGWLATLKQSSVSIEGNSYDGYADLRSRVEQLVAAAAPIIDSDIWTRVGLRYINTIYGDPADGWVNRDLVGPIGQELLRPVNSFGGALQVGTLEEGALLRHQLALVTNHQGGDVSTVSYVIDLDVFQAAVSVTDTFEVLDKLHERSFALFQWTLGERAKSYLQAKD